MKKTKKESLVLGRMLRKIAPRIGARIFLEPEWNIAGQILFADGRKSYFRYNTLDLNPVGSADIAKDKDYSNLFMKRLGYPIVPGSKTFFSDHWADAIGSPRRKIDNAFRYARGIGFPVIVKPNSGSQGSGVSLVHTKRQFYKAMRAVFKQDRVALVQKPVTGKDYRIVVLDNEVISVYQRIPLSVVGNGKSTISQLLKQKQKEFVKKKRDTRIKFDDPRMLEKLKRQGLSLKSVLSKGERLYLLDNANLSTGGDSVDVTEHIHPTFAALCIKLTKDMGLRLCGVDLMIANDIALPANSQKFWVLEINAAPGLDHYAKSGKKQEKIVEDLYLKVLRGLNRRK